MPQSIIASRVQERAAMWSLGVGVALLAVKFTGYFVTGSSAIFSDALESIVNVVASAFALFAVTLANRPADREHPYGHGKVEFLSAGFEGGMIVVAAMVIVAEAIRTLLFREVAYTSLGFGMGLMALAGLVNGAMGAYLVALGKRHDSLALEADGRHLMSDAVTSVAALVALAAVRFLGWTHADPICALLIAAYIGWMGVRLVRRSAAGLMDEQDVAEQVVLEGILHRHVGAGAADPRICSFHKLRHRHSGRYHWVDFHIMLPGDWSIDRGHRAASAIEYEIEQTLGVGNATAHIEPCADADCGACAKGRGEASD